MSHSVAEYLRDMVEAAQRAQRHVAGLEEADFLTNELVLDATVRAIEVMGEAAKHVPPNVRERESEVPWRQISGMRDLVIHAYNRVDPAIVWRTVRVVLPEVEPLLASALERQQAIESAMSD